MSVMAQKKLASRIMKCGTTRVWFDPTRMEDIAEALTARDMKSLIKDGIVRRLPVIGNSSFRKNKIAARKKKGRRQGRGSRSGRASARTNPKTLWIKKIRTIRTELRSLKEQDQLDTKTYRDLYMKSKSGFFRNKGHLKLYIERNNLIKTSGEKRA